MNLLLALAALIIWTGDGDQPINQQWAEYSTTQHCAVTSDHVTTDSRVQRSGGVLNFTVRDGDDCYGERAELGQALPSRPGFTDSRPFRQGDDRWIAFRVRLASGFPVSTGNWQVVAQWKQLVDPLSSFNGCSPVLALQVHGGRYWLERANPSAPCGSTLSYDLGPARTGVWERFTLHIIFKTAGGTFAAYNGTGPLRHSPLTIPTLANEDKAGGAPVPSHSRIGIYRNAAINGTASLTFDGYTVATTRAAAEANAY